MTNPVDRSDAADARRFRWIVDGNGYFLEEEGICGHDPTDEEKDEARWLIDNMLTAEAKIHAEIQS